jgi:hypothetical protein
MPIYDSSRASRGDVLTAERINRIEDAIRRLGNVEGGAGVVVRRGVGGIQLTGARPASRYFARAHGAVTSRNGSSPGVGLVDVMHVDETGVVAEAASGSGLQIPVSNPDAARALADGEYCWIEQDPFGAWHVVAAGEAATFVGKVVDLGAMPTTISKYVVVNPVAVSGTATEGGAGTLAVDTTTRIAVDWIGSAVPAVGMYVVVSTVAGRHETWKKVRSSTCVPCSPCCIPKRNLTVTWTNAFSGGGSVQLTFDGVSQWTSACAGGVVYKLACVGGSTVFTATGYTGGCPGGTPNPCSSSSAAPANLHLASSSCTPFVLDYVPSAGATTYCSFLTAQGFSDFTITE